MSSTGPAAVPASDTAAPHGRQPHLIGRHEHPWKLRSTDVSGGTAVRGYGCGSCGSAWFD